MKRGLEVSDHGMQNEHDGQGHQELEVGGRSNAAGHRRLHVLVAFEVIYVIYALSFLIGRGPAVVGSRVSAEQHPGGRFEQLVGPGLLGVFRWLLIIIPEITQNQT